MSHQHQSEHFGGGGGGGGLGRKSRCVLVARAGRDLLRGDAIKTNLAKLGDHVQLQEVLIGAVRLWAHACFGIRKPRLEKRFDGLARG